MDPLPPAIAAGMIMPEEDNDEKGRGYVDSLLGISLQLLRHGLVPEVRRQGLNLMLHLLRFRWDGRHIEEWRSSFSGDAGLIAGLYDTTDILPSKSDVESLMTESPRINIFQGCGPGNDLEQNIIHGIADIDFEGFTKSVDEKMLDVSRTMSCHPEKNQLLLMEHNILSETFVTVASFPRIQDSNCLLTDLLHSLNTIWTQPDWKKTYVCYTYRLSGLFADYQFTMIVHSLVKSFETVLTSNRVVESTGVEGHSSASSCTLSKLILTLVLKVLGCIQTLWNGPIAYNLSGVVDEDIRLLLENGNQPMIAETKLQKTAGTWLKDIRDTGYKIIASERLNSGLSLLPSQPKDSKKADFHNLKATLIGFLLHHNCFGRLSMHLFGCLVDHQAAKKALPFCYTLIRLAISSDLVWLNQFILNEMLPTVILLLSGVQCSLSELFSSLNSATKEDAKNDIEGLCHHIYEIYIDNQVVGESTEKQNISCSFKGWLANEVSDLCKRASCSVPEHFPKSTIWKWEFNEEFERYLPAYMSMLVEVDAINDCLKNNYLGCDNLFERLEPEFKLKYGINDSAHPYLWTMSRMLERKRPAVYFQNRTIWLSELLSRLITLKPYIKFTDSWESVMGRLQENCKTPFDPLQCDPARAVNIFLDSILFSWEPQFHPLIRESHKDILKTMACELVSAEEFLELEPLEPDSNDFIEHLQPYAQMYIKRKKEESGYFRFEEQICLHKEFDDHLALGSLDNHMNDFSRSKNEFVHEVVNDSKYSRFAKLDHDLIKMSFERRAKIVEWEHQISLYSRCLTLLLESDEMKNELKDLMNILNAKGFFRVDDDSIDWDQKLFSDLVEQFGKVVFSGQRIHQSLVIRGIMDYQNILKMKDVGPQAAYRMVVSNTIYSWKENLQEFWMATRHYKHEYYEILSQPLQKVFLLDGPPKPNPVESVIVCNLPSMLGPLVVHASSHNFVPIRSSSPSNLVLFVDPPLFLHVQLSSHPWPRAKAVPMSSTVTTGGVPPSFPVVWPSESNGPIDGSRSSPAIPGVSGGCDVTSCSTALAALSEPTYEQHGGWSMAAGTCSTFTGVFDP
ncbi:hypothetical protein QOZ80_9AG0687640 [Eleusine coracana subsp. coracana]|nr:hypothetical protein QOZ80_9AG0687640 [Eleusine coracana subsp. coracana]